MTQNELWFTPTPSSGFREGVVFAALPQRVCDLSFYYEGASGNWDGCVLRFNEVAAFKCTYMPALTSEMIESAYDKLIDMGNTAWLEEAALVQARRSRGVPLRHLRICFDDGPCYEFLCRGFEVGVVDQ
jgi:hypothetical protein